MKTVLKYFISVFVFYPLLSPGQQTTEAVQKKLNEKITGVRSQEQVKRFYELLDNRLQWITTERSADKNSLLYFLASSEQLGLNERDYQFDFVQSIRNNTISLSSIDDSIRADVLLSDAAIHFFTELAFGNSVPDLGYNGLDYQPEHFDVIQKLSELILKNNLRSAISFFEPDDVEYKVAKNRLNQYLQIINQSTFREVVIRSNKLTVSNLPLLTKFYQLGFVEDPNKKISEEQLKIITKYVQKLFNVKEEKSVSQVFLKALNIPIATRVTGLTGLINTIRWLHKARNEEPIILVNIPSATLLVYQENKLILESKIIVGKPTTPTPRFTSRVTDVILYPYWMVPKKIAVKELLPSIKRNTGFISDNNYQVLNKNGNVVNPYKIDWSSLSASNFPYVIRQSTGCDNALGIVKLNFYSPYGVFLHDTPGKTLFSYSRRYFSHGCMRVEKAIELAHLVLKGNEIAIDTIEAKGCLQHQSPVVVAANNKMAVFVLYNTAWFNSDMSINFSEDVYKKLNPVFKKD